MKFLKLQHVSKWYQTRSGVKRVLEGIDLDLHMGERIGILGRNGAGKSTLIRIISGAELPSQGRVVKKMSISWPLAFGGGFQGSLTGLDNLRFVCRIYGAPIEPAIPFVEEFSELGPYLREPVKRYSSGMRARLAFAISMAIDFDCFLIDEVVAVGDSRFHKKCHEELFDRRGDRAMILVSHDLAYVRDHCHKAAVLENGKLLGFDKIHEAIEYYQKI